MPIDLTIYAADRAAVIADMPIDATIGGAAAVSCRKSTLSETDRAAAAIVHDYLYREGEINGRKIMQREADEIMLAVMKYNANVPRHKAYAIYIGVRLGGLPTWNKYRRKARAL